MTFKNPSHHQSLEQPSFSERKEEKDLTEKQTKPELATDDRKKEELIKDATERDNARIDEIKSQIEKMAPNTTDGIDHMLEATRRNREDIKRINALKRAAGEPVIQPEKENIWTKIRSFFE
ncbi:MAG: hypothetical protein WC878_06610 [Candidatus Paceibacterota bacterium]|jgi:hypothetical protein